MNGNDFMSWVLRSPLHGMLSSGMMLITVIGSKTGKKYTTPVGYYSEDGYLWVITSRDRTWWRNLRGGAEVELLLNRKSVNAFAELELDEQVVIMKLYEYLRHMPQAAKSMGIHVKNGFVNAEDVTRVAKGRLFVRLQVF